MSAPAHKIAATPENNGKKNLGTVAQAAAYLSMSRAWIYAEMDAGRIPYIRLGRTRRIEWETIETLIEQNRVG